MTTRKLYRADVAALLGVEINSLQRAGLPERDGTDIDGGKARPYWHPATIKAWAANRPGRGARTDLHRS